MKPKNAVLLLLLAALPILLGLTSAGPGSLQFQLATLSQPHVETVTGWMVENTVAKITGGGLAPAGPDVVREHFALVDELARSPVQTDSATALTGLAELRSANPAVEKAIQDSVTEAALSAGLGQDIAGRTFLFPMVYFKFTSLPKLLVVSPRHRIAREATVLLDTDLSPRAAERLEERSAGENRSTLVTSIGGLAAYPSMVPESGDPRWTFRTIAHEWVHQYLAFRPLGWRYALGGEGDGRMISVNETAAEVVGRELGDELYRKYYPDAPEATAQPTPRDTEFRAAMREIRGKVDALLELGNIEEAESYMELSRQDLEKRGFSIRRLNQAYFAFYGTYADDPSTGGRTGQEISARVRGLRAASPTLGEFLWRISTATSYDHFLQLTGG